MTPPEGKSVVRQRSECSNVADSLDHCADCGGEFGVATIMRIRSIDGKDYCSSACEHNPGNAAMAR